MSLTQYFTVILKYIDILFFATLLNFEYQVKTNITTKILQLSNRSIQSSIKWRKKIVPQILESHYKRESLIFKSIVDLVMKNIFQCLYIL